MRKQIGLEIIRHRLQLVAARTMFCAALAGAAFPCAQAATMSVTNTEDSGPGSLRAALAAANDGDTVDATGVSGTITLTNGQLLVSNSVTIAGPGASLLTISGNDTDRILFINPGAPGATSPPSGPFPTVNISGVTLAHGNAQGGAGGPGGGGGAAGMGGALFINGGDVTLDSVNLSQNVARGGAGQVSSGSVSGEGGGGGVGGDGTSSKYAPGVGGSGDGLGGNGGAPNSDGGEGAGGGGSAPPGSSGGHAGNGGFGGGGGGGGKTSPGDLGSNGGNGGYGGGGGGAGYGVGVSSPGGRGGTFGGGGGGSTYPANYYGTGGGGAGLGGAIFLRLGSLSICGGVLSSNSAFHGLGAGSGGFAGAGTNGMGKGGAIFVYTNAVAQAAATTFTSNTADDDAGTTGDTADVFGVLSTPAPPNITCPSNIVTQPDAGKCTATVTFAPVATGSCALTTVCTPASGSAFSIGTNTVNCTATDAASNSVSCSFTIIVTAGNRCPLGSGFWKSHPSLWPVSQLTLGANTYGRTQLISILNNPTMADASVILARELIATLLNEANGSNPCPISSTVADANRLIDGARIPSNIKTSSTTGKAMLRDANLLDNYNLGGMTPGCTP
jgi:hypothetical protein